MLAEELRDSATRLDALSGGDLSTDLRAVMSCSLRSLDRDAETAFLLLALAPGPDIGLPAAASLLAAPPARARRLLGVLENAHLVQQYLPDRYRLHDLVRLFGAERGEEKLTDEMRDEAWERLFDFYLRTAHEGSLLIHPHKLPEIELDASPPGTHRMPLENVAAALHWFDTEQPCLLAAHRFALRRKWHLYLYRLTWSLDTFQERRHHVRDLLSTWRSGLVAARWLGEPGYEIEACRRLANAASRMDDHAEGMVWAQRALDLAESSGDLLNLALTHISLSCLCGEHNDFPGFLDHSLRALGLFERLGYPGKVAHALGHVGEAHAMMGHYGPAEKYCLRALALARRHRNVAVEADTLHSLGYIAHHTGNHRVARHRYEQSLARFRDNGNRYDEATALEHLGGTYTALGETSEARATLRQALALYRMQGRDTQAERVAQALVLLPSEELDA
ncbi:tetratricopeptide repeat protein [Streptomyces sp. NPDC004539]|uniref:tetratricopeptide repeat protein n=1 Tax=Streptomyces sp. NPDC004539 TaxID=3154280 RepID=UPI0033BD6C64